jgi:hypothetical protein
MQPKIKTAMRESLIQSILALYIAQNLKRRYNASSPKQDAEHSVRNAQAALSVEHWANHASDGGCDPRGIDGERNEFDPFVVGVTVSGDIA